MQQVLPGGSSASGRRAAGASAEAAPADLAVHVLHLAPGTDEQEDALPPPEPSAAELAQQIKVSDWAVFAVTFLVTCAAYLVTIYANKPFGSLADYLGAFTAAFAGQVFAGVAVIPSRPEHAREGVAGYVAPRLTASQARSEVTKCRQESTR